MIEALVVVRRAVSYFRRLTGLESPASRARSVRKHVAGTRLAVLLLLTLTPCLAHWRDPQSLVPVDHRVSVTFAPWQYDARTGALESRATARNFSGRPVYAPLRLVLDDSDHGALTAVNPAGRTADGRPYFDFTLVNGALQGGETTIALTLKLVRERRSAWDRFDLKRYRPDYRLYASTSPGNVAPIANAGPDQSAHIGELATLDGAGSSDANGDRLRFHWTLTRRPPQSRSDLIGAENVHPTIMIDQAGDYEAELTVSDGRSTSGADAVRISTINSKPVAKAGPDQTAPVGARVALDGLMSTDVDGDALSYRWRITAKPEGSQCELDDGMSPAPTITLDRPGRYQASLTVNDGALDSEADALFVDTVNSRPVAVTGSARAVTLGETVSLDGSASSDADADPLSFSWSLIKTPDGSKVQVKDPLQVSTSFTPDLPGSYLAQLVVNDGALDSEPSTTEVSVSQAPPPENHAPAITSVPILSAQAGVPYEYRVTAEDSDGDALSFALQVAPVGMVVDPLSGVVTWTPLDEHLGTTAVVVTASDAKGGTAAQHYAIDVQPGIDRTVVPKLSGLNRPEAERLAHDNKLIVSTVTFAHDKAPEGTVIAQMPNAGGVVTIGASIALTISLGADAGLPPSPATVAPPLDPTAPASPAATMDFLYSGPNPTQTGVNPGAIDRLRVGVIRGRVISRDGVNIPGVSVSVHGHAEFGSTRSRADGGFDLAVNGGGILTVDFQKAGFLPVQRTIRPANQDYVVLDDVAMIELDSRATPISLGSTDGIQVAEGNPVTDEDGNRLLAAMFPAGTHASMRLPDGSIQPLTTLTVRATEYSVGRNGPRSMPGALPATSGYTYAIELSADEALAAGAERIEFDRPVPVYVDNFLDFPVGTPVPAGYYDRNKAAWIASENGRVIKIIGVQGEQALIDADGNGASDDDAQLSKLGISLDERTSLANRYQVGQTFWRVPITHFTPWDFNWPFGPPADARAPLMAAPSVASGMDDPDCQSGSIIECQTQTLGEVLPVSGTGLSLNYRSDRTAGRKAARTLTIPLSGPQIPTSLKRIDLEISVAGRRTTQSFAAAAGLSTPFTWDGLDAYGRPLHGTAPVEIRIGYVYDAQYQTPASFERSFGAASGVPISGNKARQEITLWQVHHASVGSWEAIGLGLGGWSLSIHHAYDPGGRVLYRGDGSRQSADAQAASIITTVAGGCGGSSGDGGLATKACLDYPEEVLAAPDGGFFIADELANRVRRVDSAGIIRTVAGTGILGYSGDGGPATSARLYHPKGLTLGPDGSLYITDWGNAVIRRVDPKGIITTIAGTGKAGYSGDGGPATSAQLFFPTDVAAGPDGSLYIADEENNRIRRIDPDGRITTVAGTGVAGFTKESLPATTAMIYWPYSVAVGTDGSVLFSERPNHRIRRISPDGMLSTFAGKSGPWELRDGQQATDTLVYSPVGIALGPDQSLYFLQGGEHRVRRVGPDGIVTTIAGNGTRGQGTPALFRDGWPATLGALQDPMNASVGPDGSLYIADSMDRAIRRISPALPGFSSSEITIASSDGAEVYVFDQGRHTRTLSALDGHTLYRFAYDPQGRLIAATDQNGLSVKIERDSLGNATGIVAPFGQRTALGYDDMGYLSSLRNEAGEAFLMEYSKEGLLAQFTTPEGHASTFRYDPLGLLTEDRDAAGGSKTLTRVELAQGFTASVTTGLGRSTQYTIQNLATGAEKRRTSYPDGAWVERLIGTAGETHVSSPDGSSTDVVVGPDPRFGMQAPQLRSATITTAGLTQTIASEQTVALNDPRDIFSIKSLSEKVTVNGLSSTTIYDAASRTLTTTSPAKRSAKTTFDDKGRVVQVEAPGLPTAIYHYDAFGRVDQATLRSGHDERTVGAEYDARGRLGQVSDMLGRMVRYEYDLADRLVSQTLSDGRSVSFEYDRNGLLKALSPPSRPAHRFNRTKTGSIQEYAPPTIADGGTTRFEYDKDGGLTRITRPEGDVLDLAYDNAGRLSTLTTPDSEYGYRYDANTGRLVGVVNADDASIELGYQGALITRIGWVGAISGTVAYRYDNDFRVSTISVNGADPIAYRYDADGLLIKAGDLVLTRSVENGSLQSTTLGAVAETLTHDGFGDVSDIRAVYGETEILSLHYRRDASGRIVGRSETIGTTTSVFDYEYDSADHLSAVSQDGRLVESFRYDDNGNRLELGGATAVYDEQDRLIEGAGIEFRYNKSGQLESRTEGNAITRYRYDALGNLRQVSLPNGRHIEYLIDTGNRRVGRKVDGALTQRFLYEDSLRPAAEFDGEGTLIARYVYATHPNVPDYIVKGGRTYHLITDHLGSPRLVVAIDDGTVIQRIDYDVWGKVTRDTNPGFQPFGFAGGLYDQDTGLVRFGARDYDPRIGRWTAKDPILFEGGSGNIYGYVGNDPLQRTDPTGLLFGGALDAGESYGDSAAQYWAILAARTGHRVYDVAGVLAALWTPCTSDATAATLSIATGLGRYFGRPFWQYYPVETPSYVSQWMTRGWGWKPPYSLGEEAVRNLSLPAWNPATAVRPINPPWWQFVRGPRPVKSGNGHPGGGLEYYRNLRWPD
ncbi:MAG: PKD domain-containing protein [Methylotetracoccus sp.]